MKRELKFRVWNKLSKKMSKPFDLNMALVFYKHPPLEDFHEVMQFTGLKDKNGKEIYEGDIFSFIGIKSIVIFENGAFIFEAKGMPEGALISDVLRLNPSEIIGNIYENPDLIK